MNRRQFLRYSATWGASFALGNILSSCVQLPIKPGIDGTFLRGLRIIDAHAHPDHFYQTTVRSTRTDETSTLKTIQVLGMVASSFAAVGDSVFLSRGHLSGSEYGNTKAQFKWVNDLGKSDKVKFVLKASDVPDETRPNHPVGAILTIEGGDPLEGRPERVDEFYNSGVRMITLVHYRNNELGAIMQSGGDINVMPSNNGLSHAGRRVVQRMQELGMVVDLAHAHSITLKQVVAMSARPLVDSHTSPCPAEDPSECGRFRTWKDMELVAKTGGVVCTWPLAATRPGIVRKTFLDWAKEILEMKKRLGMEHVGLGTDGGGGLPFLIDGYRDVRDLVHLVAAMQEVGLSYEDIKSYMGGNFYRVLQHGIG